MSIHKHSLTLVSGDKKSLQVESLYRQYQQSLLNYLTGIMPGGRHDAQEILHETYIRLLRHNDLNRLEENPRAYIFTIATNLVRDHLRRGKSRREDAHSDADDCELTSDSPNPGQAACWAKSLEQLKLALMQLKPQTRQIFLLSRFEEFTYVEIAERLKLSPRTVERHMSKASQELRSALGDAFLESMK